MVKLGLVGFRLYSTISLVIGVQKLVCMNWRVVRLPWFGRLLAGDKLGLLS